MHRTLALGVSDDVNLEKLSEDMYDSGVSRIPIKE